MSADFQLQFTGDPAPCSYPHCIREAFHDGEHEFKQDKRTEFPFLYGPEADRAIAEILTTSYGQGTRSYNRSGVKRELDRIAERAKERAANELRVEYFAPLLCPCPQRPYAHELAVHHDLRSESYNPARRFVYPWSLCLSERRELSTERKVEG